MFYSFMTMVLLLLTPSHSFDDQNEKTPFYSIAVDEVNLSLVQIESNDELKYPGFKKENKSCFTLLLNNAQKDYYDTLSELDKKVFVKLVSLGVFKERKNKDYLGNRYTLLYKKQGAFNIETIAVVPVTYEGALPIIKNYASYNDWVLKDANVRRDGEKGKYFFDINSLRYFTEKDQRFLELNVSMTKISKGNFSLKLLIQDSTNLRPVSFFSLKMNEPSDLAKNVEGTFKFIMPPNIPYFIIFFTGKAEVGWVYYKFLPINLIRSQFVERIYTILENIQFKAESVKPVYSTRRP